MLKLDTNSISREADVFKLNKFVYNSHSSVLVNGVIYFFGNNLMYSYSVFSKKFIGQTSLPYTSQKINRDSCACNFMSKVYIMGGNIFGRSCHAIDPKTNTWKENKKMITRRSYAACSVFGGKIDVSGGT